MYNALLVQIRSSLLWEATKRHCRVQKSRSVIMDNNEEEEEEAEEEEAIGPYGHRQADVQQLRYSFLVSISISISVFQIQSDHVCL